MDGHTTQHNIVNLPILDTYKKGWFRNQRHCIGDRRRLFNIHSSQLYSYQANVKGGGVLGQRIYQVQEQGGWKTRLNIALVFKRHPSAAPTSNSQSHPLCQDMAEMIFESAS